MTAARAPLAVGLMTCGREGLTSQSLASWHQLNFDLEAQLLHVDDASEFRSNEQMAQRYGFETVWSGKQQLGQVEMLKRLLVRAMAQNATHFLLLENDWLWHRALPTHLSMPANIDCIRLYGAFKGPNDTQPARTTVMGSERPIEWEHYSKGWQRGLAHWGGPPSIVRIDALWQAMEKATNYKAISLASRHFRTLRPLKNFVTHLGAEQQTPGFIA